MRILHTYLLREFLAAFALAFLILTFVMALGQIIFLVGLVITKGVALTIVFELLVFMVASALQFILPLSIMAGLLLSLGRLSSDNEILSIRASGISSLRLIFPFLVIGIILSLSLIVVNDKIVPQGHYKLRATMQKLGSKNPTAILEPGVFINAFDKYILFVDEINGNRFRNIRIYEPQGNNKPPRIIIAKRGEFVVLSDQNLLKLKLIDGTMDEINPNNPNVYYKVNFNTYFMNLDFAKGNVKDSVTKKPKDMTLKEMWAEMNRLRSMQINSEPIATEFHERIALSSSAMIFFLLGVPLGIMTRRREKTANIAIALVVVGAYFILTLCAEGLCKNGNLAASSGMWIPNILSAFIGIFLFFKYFR